MASVTAGHGRLWYSEPWRIRVYDLSHPSSPQPVAEIPDVGVPAAVARDRAYSVDNRVTVLDVKHADRPDVAGWLPVPGSAGGIAAAGRYAYLLVHGGWHRLYVIDAADTFRPRFV